MITPINFEQLLIKAGYGNAKGARRYLDSLYCKIKSLPHELRVGDLNVIATVFERYGWTNHANRIRKLAIMGPSGRLRYDCRREDLTPVQLAYYVEDMAANVRNAIARARKPVKTSHIADYRSNLVLLTVSMKTAIYSGALPEGLMMEAEGIPIKSYSFGSWLTVRGKLLGTEECHKIGMQVCKEENFTIKEGEDLLGYKISTDGVPKFKEGDRIIWLGSDHWTVKVVHNSNPWTFGMRAHWQKGCEETRKIPGKEPYYYVEGPMNESGMRGAVGGCTVSEFELELDPAFAKMETMHLAKSQ